MIDPEAFSYVPPDINFELPDSLVRSLIIKRLMSVHVFSDGRYQGFDMV
tara:strand:+ start:101 stop:247 length:147 start_codon:yes stop_codon:yes gene_type:complete